MGLSQNHVLGHFSKNYVMKETTAGTFVKAITGAGALAGGSVDGKFNFTPNHSRIDLIHANMASRDVIERITSRTEHSWAYEGKYVPSGTKNLAPHIGVLIECALGSGTINADDVTYALTGGQSLPTCSIVTQQGTELQQAAAGCMVEDLGFKFAPGEEPMMSASGRCMTFVTTGRTTLNGAVASGATTMAVNDAYALDAMPGAYGVDPPTDEDPATGARSVITIDDGSNTEDDIEVDGTDARPTFDITAITEATGHGDEANVYPYVPTHTPTDKTPISGVTGALTYDSTIMIVQSFEFTVKNNWKFFDDECFYQHMYDGVPSIRDISGVMTLRLRRDFLIKVLDRQGFTTKALTCNVGGAAQSGTRLEVSMPYVEPNWSGIQVPDTDECIATIPFKALGSSGNDALTIKHT